MQNKNYHIGIVAVVMLSVLGIYFMTRESKNVRNKNPLNIEKGADWKGLQAVQNDVRFAQFTHAKYGFRAGYIILLQYLERGDDDLQKIINKWAPSGTEDKNHTDNYIDYIADKVELSPSETVTPDLLPEIMLHMSNFEGGKGHFTLKQAQQGESLGKQENFVQSRLARIEENNSWFGGVFS